MHACKINSFPVLRNYNIIICNIFAHHDNGLVAGVHEQRSASDRILLEVGQRVLFDDIPRCADCFTWAVEIYSTVIEKCDSECMMIEILMLIGD